MHAELDSFVLCFVYFCQLRSFVSQGFLLSLRGDKSSCRVLCPKWPVRPQFPSSLSSRNDPPVSCQQQHPRQGHNPAVVKCKN